MLIQNSLYLILNFVGIKFINQALATSCQIYPSEYAYRGDSIDYRAERDSAKCRSYPVGSVSQHQYIHCDGTRLQLADSNLGQEQYQATDCYRWPANRDGKLLFIFPTRVSLTTITLHYYIDNYQGLPRLRFYAVPDDFDVWDTLPTSTPHLDVAEVSPDEELTGRRNVSISVNFNTTKVLMYKYSSNFVFAVSEVEFFTCNFTSTATTADTSTSSKQTESDDHHIMATTFPENLTTMENFDKTSSLAKTTSTTPGSMTNKKMMTVQPNSVTGIIAIGVSIAILLILSTILIITVVVLVWCYKRRSTKQNLIYTDSPYSTFSRETGQQIQPQSLQNDSTKLYDQLHLSPSTGQTEFISTNETANINKSSLMPWNSHPTYSTASDDRAEHSSALNAANQAITSQKTHEITCEQLTYAAIDKSKKKKIKKQSKKEDPECKIAEKRPPVSPYRNDSEVPSASMQEKKEKAEQQTINPPNMVEELYTAVKKKPKGSQPNDEEETPPIPPHTVEELYTAVEKKPKSIPDKNKEKAPKQSVLQNMTEDRYTAAMKKPKDDSTVTPLLPPHTVEELYTAVMKQPKESTEDEEEAPPIPPYTVEEN